MGNLVRARRPLHGLTQAVTTDSVRVLFHPVVPGQDMSFPLLLRGLLIGVSIAAPVGPIGVLCIRRTLADGRLTGFVSGLGAAAADMIYGAIAAFGITAILDLLTGQADWLRLIGGLFLLYLGIKTMASKPAEEAARSGRSGLAGAFLSTFALTLTNPMTILSFTLIFAGSMPAGSDHSPATLVAGVFLGSAAWWLTLSLGVSLLRDKLEGPKMTWINRGSGMLLVIFALAMLLLEG